MTSPAERRSAILGGSSAAAELLEDLGLRESLRDGHAAIDVFRIIAGLDVGFMFRPLGGLLGAFLPPPLGGILVTTQRDLHVQRFTAAHELGHFVLGHSTSLDDEGCIGFVARGGSHSSAQEIAADAFASELLVPRWLLRAHVDRQGWSAAELRTPGIVYQLSLRLGVSYAAMCWALAGQQVVSRAVAERLSRIAPRESKLAALEGRPLENSWADVWLLSDRDDGLEIVGSPDDLIRLELTEHPSAGATWSFEPAQAAGLEIVSEELRSPESEAIGGIAARRVLLKGQGEGEMTLEERRHWDPESRPRQLFDLTFSLYGKEQGKPRVMRVH